MDLTQAVKEAIIVCESRLSERESKDHRKLRKNIADILKWLQCQKVGFLVPKPNYTGEEYLPEDLREYLKSEYCQSNEILILYGWEIDIDQWLSTGENRNFWKICQKSLVNGVPMSSVSPKSGGLGSPNTWERGKD
jgi:hypothetical protein